MRAVLAMLLVWSTSAAGQPPAGENRPYSPSVDRTFPDNVYWGDTHLHTYLSGDAFALGTRLTPEDAYRFAKGETLRATGGEKVRLRRPLDFLMVADHAENLGAVPRLAAGDPRVEASEDGQRWAEVLASIPALPDILNAADPEGFDQGNRELGIAKASWQAGYTIDDDFRREVWHEVIAVAEKHNDPGRFTAFAGFEWSGRDPGMIHRNVLFAGGPEQTQKVLPFSRFDSDNEEDLWSYLQDYVDRVGGEVIAIPHNSNLSGGRMFRPTNYDNQPFTKAYAQTRSSLEPIVEVTQIKGDSETHSIIAPNDEFADYETWGGGPPKAKPGAPAPDLAAYEESVANSYARSALKAGLGHEAELGVNPFKFGMIGSTDSHTALATADEDNFWGKMGLNEPSPYRAVKQWIFSSSGYAAVWAEENTRESLFAAMKRREVYATTGPRMTVRFFAGWHYADDDAASSRLASIGYERGVPMGGDLARAPSGKRPNFLIRAVKDPDGANLDRVQVVKGWRTGDGKLHEQVYDVALADGRAVDSSGKVAPVGSTVDLDEPRYTNSIGDPELSVVWRDPDFDPDELAFYYVRVVEIPTPRWTAYDASFYDLGRLPEDVPMVTQERAYTSPIWYTPE